MFTQHCIRFVLAIIYLNEIQLTLELASISSTIFCKYKVEEYQSD